MRRMQLQNQRSAWHRKLYTGSDINSIARLRRDRISENSCTDVVGRAPFKENRLGHGIYSPGTITLSEAQFPVITLLGTLQFKTRDGETFLLQTGECNFIARGVSCREAGHEWWKRMMRRWSPWKRCLRRTEAGAKGTLFIRDPCTAGGLISMRVDGARGTKQPGQRKQSDDRGACRFSGGRSKCFCWNSGGWYAARPYRKEVSDNEDAESGRGPRAQTPALPT